MSGIKDYSTTPSSNTDLFPEGMNPSDVNNGMRQVQADIREWFEDVEWRNMGHTPVYVSAGVFKVSGNVTTTYVAGRRLRLYGTTMGTFYGTVSSSSYSSPDTTINVTLDSGSLTSNLSIVSLGVTPTNKSVPWTAIADVSLGYGTLADQDADDVAITGGDVSGVTMSSVTSEIIGGATVITDFYGTPVFQVQVAGGNSAISLVATSSNTSPANINFIKRRTGGAAINSGDYLASIRGSGSNGTSNVAGAYAFLVSTGSATANHVPTSWYFGCRDSSGTDRSKFRIHEDGTFEASFKGSTSLGYAAFVRVWATLDMSSFTILDDMNVNTITDGGTGKGTVDFTEDMPHDDYAISGFVYNNSGTGAAVFCAINTQSAPAVGGFDFAVIAGSTTLLDSTRASFMVVC